MHDDVESINSVETDEDKNNDTKTPGSLDRSAKTWFSQPTNENLEKIMSAGSGLIVYLAKAYNNGIYNEDLTQVGYEALIRALKKYDPSFGAAFSTFAWNEIKGAIRHYLRKDRSYYVPGAVAELRTKINNYIEENLKTNFYVPAISDIAAHLKIKPEAVTRVLQAGLVPIEDLDFRNISDQTSYTSFKLPLEDRIALEIALKKLSDIEKKVIKFAFYYDLTQIQIAKILGLSQKKVSRITIGGIKKMRSSIDPEE